MSDALKHMAERVKADPFFLAYPLAGYAAAENLDDPALAAALGVGVEDLTRLRLCRAPRDTPAARRDDVTEIAAAFGIAPTTLMEVLNRGQAVARLKEKVKTADRDGAFLAARDGDPPAEGEPS
jgi:hypothetical protein